MIKNLLYTYHVLTKYMERLDELDVAIHDGGLVLVPSDHSNTYVDLMVPLEILRNRVGMEIGSRLPSQ